MPTGYARVKELASALSTNINRFGVVFLMGMMLLMVADVVMRRVFQSPITGSYEIVQMSQLIIVFLGLAYTMVHRAHIRIDLLTSKFSDRINAFVNTFILAMCLGFSSLVTWRNILKAERIWEDGSTTVLLSIPLFPFYYLLAFGSAVLSLVILFQLIDEVVKGSREFPPVQLWSLYFLILLIISIPLAFAYHLFGGEMEYFAVGLLGICCLLILMAFGMPIAFAMGITGLAGYCYLIGVDAGFSQLESVPFGVGSDYVLSALPLFLLMGQFAFYSGLSQDLYDASYKWLGKYPGGLAMATIGGCAAFAAVCGSSVATSAAMGTVAYPAMKKYKYNVRLALGSIAAGGTIGILIPPSIVFILYGILAEQSIGKLFLAGFLPGILAIVLYIAAIIVQVRINPSLGPAGPRSSMGEKLLALRSTWGTIFLFSLVMGGIYMGVMTPTEAGAVGAFGAFIMALAKRRLTWKTLMNCLLDTGRTTSMLIFIFVGAMLLNYFLAVTNLPMDMAQIISDMNVNRYIILCVILMVYMMLGCIMDPGSMIILTIPIVFPVIQSLQFDPIWFGVIIVMVAEIGTLTPPVGLNVYVVKSVAPDVPLSTVFRGILPFWAADIFRLAILVAIPQIALFLPGLLR